MLRRIAHFACIACLFASGVRAGELAPTSDSPQFGQSSDARRESPSFRLVESDASVRFDDAKPPRTLGHDRSVTHMVWLWGEDPPPPPPQLVQTVPDWQGPTSTTTDRVSRLPEVDLGLPRSESDFLVKRRWAHMPAFEVVEDPVPPLMLLSYPPIVRGACQASSPPPAPAARYEEAPAAVPATPATRAPETIAPYPAAVAPYPTLPPAVAPESPVLNLPTPSADPVAMVAELFEKLKASEERGSAARTALAHAQQELAGLRSARLQATTPTSGEMVVLEISFFELDLDGVAKAELDVPGVCAEELSRAGLFALAAGGGLDCGCRLPAEAQGVTDPCDCVTLRASVAAQGPAEARAEIRIPAAGNERIHALLAQLDKVGLTEYISRPQLITQSGQAAKIQIGERIPFKKGSVTENGVTQNCIEFCTAGVEFDCKPLVLENGNVQIDLRAERASVDQQVLARIGMPAVARQSVETTLEVTPGKTAVVAGLIYEQPAVETKNGGQSPYRPAVRYAVPVPGEDRVFRHVAVEAPAAERKRIELVVLVKAKIVTKAASAADASMAK